MRSQAKRITKFQKNYTKKCNFSAAKKAEIFEFQDLFFYSARFSGAIGAGKYSSEVPWRGEGEGCVTHTHPPS
jgi:hypothetical protein